MKAFATATLGLLLIASGGGAWVQPTAKAKPATATKKTSDVTLVCEAVYLPALTTWTRTVNIVYDQKRVRAVQIDGVPVYTFAIQETVILTAVDNERIQIDTAAQTWTSDFRGQATAQGRCERS
jgi:hypothetical protein